MARRPRRQVAKSAAAKRAARHPGPLSPAPHDLHNLPTQLTSFIGREQEIAEIKRLLGTTRLLTLTGSGGCGKTRLALRVAGDLLDQYPDGVRLVELAPLADPALVPNSVAAALGIPERPNRPLTDTLADYLRTKKALLLSDGCEHLRAACQSLAEHLLHDPEPLPLEANPLRGMDNVVLTAHIGTETQEFDEACRRGAVENVVAFLEGRPRNVLAE